MPISEAASGFSATARMASPIREPRTSTSSASIRTIAGGEDQDLGRADPHVTEAVGAAGEHVGWEAPDLCAERRAMPA